MKRSLHLCFFAAIAIAVSTLVACNPYDPDLHPTPFQCGDEGQCPEGYACNDEGICARGGADPQIDAAAAFQCADDSQLEPNDAPAEALMTGIDLAGESISLVGLAICPSTDRDHFKITVSQPNVYLEASVIGHGDRAPLVLNVLNMQGTRIGSGGPVTGMTQIVRLPAAATPFPIGMGTYIVQIQSGDANENNYELTIKTCLDPPCE